MPPFVPRKTVNGVKLCEGCQMWNSRTAALHNPTGELRGHHPDEWYHGTRHGFDEFMDPAAVHPLAYEDDRSDESHWNVTLGNHFTSQHQIAGMFANRGSSSDEHDEDDYYDHHDEPSDGTVIHAKLHIKKPKTYRSEYDMDQEVYEHEMKHGNTIDSHLHNARQEAHENGDEDWYDEREEFPLARKYKGDSQHVRGPNERDTGAYAWHREFRPYATGWLNSHPEKFEIAQRFKQRLKDQGYDGIVYGNDFEEDAHDKGQKHPDFHTHPVLDTPEVSKHNENVPQKSIAAIPFHTDQIEITQKHSGGETCKTPKELANPSHENIDDRYPPVRSPYRQPSLPDMDVKRTPGVPKYKPVQHVPEEHEPLSAYSVKTASQNGPYYHGTASAFEPGDLVDPSHEIGRRGGGEVFMTTDPEAAHNYGRYKAQAQWAIGNDNAEPQAYEVEPTGPVEPDDTVDERFRAWRSRHPLRVVRKIERSAKTAMTSDDPERYAFHEKRWNERPPTIQHMKDMGWYSLHAEHPEDDGARMIHAITNDGRYIGNNFFGDHPSRAGYLEGAPEVHPDYRRRGVNTAMYDWAEELGGKPMAPNPNNSSDAEAFWKTRTKTAATAPEYAANHAGKQTVWTVATPNGTKQLCQYHRDVHQSLNTASNGLAGSLGLGQSFSELLEGSQRGRCAECSKPQDTALKYARPEGYDRQQSKDSRQPRRQRQPYMPSQTKPLMPLKQSENTIKPTWYHAETRNSVEHGKGEYWGENRVKAGAELHADPASAWHQAIQHWDDGRVDFPRVQKVHEAEVEDHGDGRATLKTPAESSDTHHDHEKHPAIRSRYDDEHAPILFHGTTKGTEDDDDPEEITPSGGGQTFGPGIADPSYAYATPNLKDAWHYAEKRSENVGGKPRVYRVTPHNPEDVEKDPRFQNDYNRGNNEDDKRSKSGFQVLDEVPMSHKQEQDWRESPFNDWDDDDHDDDWGESHYGVKLANEQMELFHAEPTGPQHSPKADWHQRMVDKYTTDPDDIPEECHECYTEHSVNEGHRECRGCGERHQDISEKDDHETGYTDWDRHYPHLGSEIHRGMPIRLPADDRVMVHGLGNKGSSLPQAEQAETLLKHVKSRPLGMHWTDHGPAAEEFTTRTAKNGDSEIIVHAKKPDREHIETNWENLKHGQVFGYDDHEEAEVPLKENAPIHITGISWRPKAFGPGSHGTYPVNDWIRHDFNTPIRHEAKKGVGMKTLPTLRQVVAHDATENQSLRHCPFCGSGKIIGRADGSVECEFCHNYFTVQVQPQYPNFPQTIDGMPQQVPGMPGQVEQPTMEGGAGGGGFPPGGDEEQDGGNPFTDDAEGAPKDDAAGGDDDQSGGDEPPPFAKKSFLTVTGALLAERDYVNHLALSMVTGDARNDMLAFVRNGGE